MGALRLIRVFTDFSREKSGNIAISAALFFPVLMAASALIVDEAALYYQKRQMQAVIDLAAIHAAADPENALVLAHRALVDHRLVDPATPLAELSDKDNGALFVETGRYRPDPELAIGQRFVIGGTPANAAQVRYVTEGRLHFARIFTDQNPNIGVSALASANPSAAFSIGSRLARLEDGAINALLGPLLGSNLSLSLVGYDGLALVDVKLLQFLDALAGRINLSAGTYDEVLAARVSLKDIAVALHTAASGSDPEALDLLFKLSNIASDQIYVEMARLIAADDLADIALGHPAAGAAASLNALELLSVSALLADGNRQIGANLGLDIPRLAQASLRLVVGEPPQASWYTLGGTGSFVRTAQVRLEIIISLLGQGSLGLLTLPLYVELAPAEARLAALSCPAGRPDLGTLSLAVTPGVARIAIGRPNDFLDTSRPLTVSETALVGIGGIAQVMARGQVTSAAINPVMLHFSHADVVNGTYKTASTSTLTQSLVKSLFDDLSLRLEIFGLDLLGLLNGILGVVRGLLIPVSAVLDDTLNTIFAVLGLSIGEADVRAYGFDCRAAALVR